MRKISACRGGKGRMIEAVQLCKVTTERAAYLIKNSEHIFLTSLLRLCLRRSRFAWSWLDYLMNFLCAGAWGSKAEFFLWAEWINVTLNFESWEPPWVDLVIMFMLWNLCSHDGFHIRPFRESKSWRGTWVGLGMTVGMRWRSCVQQCLDMETSLEDMLIRYIMRTLTMHYSSCLSVSSGEALCL
jgi:hypothetical protein